VRIATPPPYDSPQGALSPRLAAFLAGKLDFAFLTRKLSDSDMAAFRDLHGHDPLVIPVAGGSWHSFGLVDPVAIIVNARNPVRGLSFARLRTLYARSTGAAPDRGELGASGWAGRPVHSLGPVPGSEQSARAGVFRERVMKGPPWGEGLVPLAEADIPARVAADDLAIGFTGLGHLVPGTKALAIAARQGDAFIAPSFAAVASGRYPLARTVDLVVDRPPGTCLRPELRLVLRYLLGAGGQRVVRQEGRFLPLTPAQARGAWRLASSCS
jgi:phosphate transport system substrate-binding protein